MIVLLNEEPVRHVLELNVADGWVRVLATDRSGSLLVNRNVSGLAEATLKGRIRIAEQRL